MGYKTVIVDKIKDVSEGITSSLTTHGIYTSATVVTKNEFDEALDKVERDLKKHRRNMNRARWRNTRLKRKH